ncbi:MAG: protease inhibitor I42 family protein [Ignavibacteriales bacterium]|nr:protease inhibitor I42 family protein [Ignavibacteriales bacterium]
MKQIILVGFLFILFACSSEPTQSNGGITGTIRYIELEGGFYGILSDDGQKYDPINLPQEYHVDGLQIEFTFNKRDDVSSFRQWGTIIEIITIKLLDIEEFEVSIDEIFEIELASNATTGYGWVWKNKSIKSIVDSVEHKYMGSNSNAMGAGGTEVWKFMGISEGEATIRLEYCRGWSPNSTVNVKEYLIKVK